MFRAIITWTGALMRHGAGIVSSKKVEFKTDHINQCITKRTCKSKAMNNELHPRGNVSRLYIKKKEEAISEL